MRNTHWTDKLECQGEKRNTQELQFECIRVANMKNCTIRIRIRVVSLCVLSRTRSFSFQRSAAMCVEMIRTRSATSDWFLLSLLTQTVDDVFHDHRVSSFCAESLLIYLRLDCLSFKSMWWTDGCGEDKRSANHIIESCRRQRVKIDCATFNKSRMPQICFLCVFCFKWSF